MEENNIRIANIITNDVVNGQGICLSVWVQGCPHHCLGCHNYQAWDFNGGTLYNQDKIIENILDLLKKNNVKRNLSILGGEPLCEQNIKFSLALAEAAHNKYPNIKVFCWTGFTIEELKNKYNNEKLFKDIDILIDGRFILTERDISLKWRGSPNQRILYKGVDF